MHSGHSILLSLLSIKTSSREAGTPPQPAHVLVETGWGFDGLSAAADVCRHPEGASLQDPDGG
ncbi:MAG: hypothetical protein WA130_16040 [Candidatus Methanoperedens sp.]